MPRTCKECGDTLGGPRRHRQDFCCTPCRKNFNNRRAYRGAQVYDMLMCMRFDRPLARTMGLWTILCRMASHWRDEDKQHRQARQSWQNPQKIINNKPYLRNE